ncbi:hypothetical protein RJ639_037907 [Escallonia herrerae]|uniref:Uncharacterized protein n=1 Tax=Escallonia herrerae TaxID=1293975 RepID=A0AA89B4P9_9ASTE|nr:hypothetical protein RJ639_037907 [Escallonia herrerae]
MNFISSAIRAKASTSVKAFTVRVDGGKLEPALGSRAHVRSSSPQKSPSFKTPRLKNPLLPPSVVTLSRRPRIMKSISFTGSPSRSTFKAVNLKEAAPVLKSSKHVPQPHQRPSKLFNHKRNFQ